MSTRFSTEEEGQTLVDYALVIGLIALVAIVSLTVLRKPVETVFNSATMAFSTATSGASGTSGTPTPLPKGSGITVAVTVLWAVVAFIFGFYVFIKLTGEADAAGEIREAFDHKDDLKS
jgi:Flp pilus assembly pilin Flp